MAANYRVEVDTSALRGTQHGQFLQAARESGFRVVSIRNNWALAVINLTERQAVKIRDELGRLGIHSSIGIS